jgi:hypothetical protein
MSTAKENLELYRTFLMNIPLESYRGELRDVKWVEQDLPPEIQPLESIYNSYWYSQNFLPFDRWFENFWTEISTNPAKSVVLTKFKKYYFDKDNNGWFKKGFKARMYRQWVSMLTQLDFCYALACQSEEEGNSLTLECNAELDRKNIDVKIGNVGFQVAKISQRKEARTGNSKKKGGVEVITIPYPVYNLKELTRLSKSSRVKQENRIAYKKALQAFYKYLELLRNGFVVFGENYINPIVENIDNIERMKEIVEAISKELSGEV